MHLRSHLVATPPLVDRLGLHRYGHTIHPELAHFPFYRVRQLSKLLSDRYYQISLRRAEVVIIRLKLATVSRHLIPQSYVCG